MNYVKQTPSAGFTMIETIIAFGVLMAAILGPVTLVGFSLAQSQASQNKLIGVNLAEEGIELARMVRDNNVICATLSSPTPVLWNANPAGGTALGVGTNNSFTVDANDLTPTTCGVATFSTPKPTADTNCSTRILNLNANGIYTYGPGTPTPFRRCVNIYVPASSAPGESADPDVADLDTSVPPAPTQMEVITKVFWVDRGIQKSINLRERLYNWR